MKALYTGFCALTVAGLLSCIALYDGVVRFGARTTPAELYDHLVSYYQPPPEGPLATAAAAPAVPRMSSRKLLEVTHFHLFSMPIYLLVLGHLFLLTGLRASTKTGWISAAGVATVIHLSAPWCVHFGGGALAWIYPISGTALLVTFAVLMGVPLYEMWRSAPAARPYASRAGF